VPTIAFLPALDSAPELKVFDMNEDDELPVPADKNKSKAKAQNASALPVQLGKKLRNVFGDADSQPVPDRLNELLEALAAKEKDCG
jgi:hypothetical protein